jgi:ornithine carbamoyltransferase
VFKQESLDQLAANAGIPVINALSDRYHPCQALADFFTLEERFGNLRGLKVAYVGDGNNTCHSLLSIGARVGAHVRVATPAGYEPDPNIVAEAKRVVRETRGKIEILRSPAEAVAGAQAIYTDVGPAWARNRKPPRATPPLPATKLTTLSSPTPRPTRSSCTVFRPIAARKSAKP